MSQAALFVWIMVVFFSYGMTAGRLLERKRIGLLTKNDWDPLQVSFLPAFLMFSIEHAIELGWLPHFTGWSIILCVGYILSAGLVVFSVSRLVKQSRRGTLTSPKMLRAVSRYASGPGKPYRSRSRVGKYLE